jgi:hypothetical protein
MAKMSKKKVGLVRQARLHCISTRREKALIDEAALFEHVAQIIENRKHLAGAYANREVTLMYWEVGRYINSAVLDNERAEYGKKILVTLSQELSWSHFIEILPLKTEDARLYYAADAARRHF